MERRRNPRQQRPRHLGRQRQRQMPGRAGNVAHRDRATRQPATATARSASRVQNAKLPNAACASRASAASRCDHRRNEVPRGGSAGTRPPRNRLPRRRKVRHQDAPRHPVHRQVMDRQQQPSGRCAPASNHTACTITPAAGASRARPPAPVRHMQARSASSSSPPISIRRRQSAARTAPAGATSKPHSAIPRRAPPSRSRKAS